MYIDWVIMKFKNKKRIKEIDEILEYINGLEKQVSNPKQIEELLKIKKDAIKEKEMLLKKI